MVEDILVKLRTAALPGMVTVWVNKGRTAPGYVDVKIRHLKQLPRMLTYLQ